MKKILAFTLVAASMAFTACVKEEWGHEAANPDVLPDNILALRVLDGNPATRAGISGTSGNVIDLGKTEDGMPLRFVDNVTKAGFPGAGPAFTKGTPATNDNVGDLYEHFSAVAYDGTSPVSLDNTKDNSLLFNYNGDDLWTHTFDTNPLAVYSSLYFFAYMPLLPDGAKLDPKARTISFKYTTPENPADQMDLLFGGVAITKENFNNATIQFHHALAGMKFAIGNDANGTIIKSVSLTNIKNSGAVVITPDADTPVVWSSVSGKAGFTLTPPGVYESNNVKNLNDSDLSLTLWLIPQTLSNDAELRITYAINGGADKTVSVKVNAALGGPLTLTAGELHTFTLNPDDVNVNITDTNAGSEVNEVVITNSGNVAAYLRAVIVANWQDADGDIVASWDFEPSEFEGLPGAGWTLAADGYYYTDATVAPGEAAPALFTGYMQPSASPVAGAHLVMDVAVQAVNRKPDSWAE